MQRGFVYEGNLFGVFLHEEVERIDGRQVGDQIDLDFDLARQTLWKDQPGLPVAEWILLPV
jgi:hypothetical protein